MRFRKTIITALFIYFAMLETVMAYVGPGAGITLIGSLVTVVAVVSLAIIGVLWYPIKILRARSRERREAREALQKEQK